MDKSSNLKVSNDGVIYVDISDSKAIAEEILESGIFGNSSDNDKEENSLEPKKNL